MSKSDYWYAVQVKSGMELELEEMIAAKLWPIGRAYCPKRKEKLKPSRHAKRKTEREVPVYSKYLFVKFGSSVIPWGVVTSIKGVDGFVRADGHPIPIRSATIEMLRNDVNAGVFNDDDTEAFLKVGDKIKIDFADESSSPFSGFTGEFLGLTKKNAGAVELSLFGRATRVEIPTELLRRILG